MSFDTLVHLFAGGLGGTFGAVVTCPLEVVKTRLQSSVANFHEKSIKSLLSNENVIVSDIASSKGPTIWSCIRHIIDTEGPKALFKGLGPNLIGVAPSRAIYFCTYSQVKSTCNQKLTPDTPYVHMISAASAGFVSCTLTNPIWFLKTRLQLDQSQFGKTALQCIKSIYKENGISGFYKGITASYFGISETIIHFVIYEFIKSKLFELDSKRAVEEPISDQKLNFFQYMAAAAASKSFASIIAYPHEVARTRLREEGEKYKRFFQTIFLVYQEEGLRNGLYRGLCTQLIRQIPNTAIMMGTYEVVVYFMKNFSCSSISSDSSPQCS